jgi:hypothetical protein
MMLSRFRVEFKTDLYAAGSADHILLNVKKNAISLAVNTFSVYTFDLTGRLITALQSGHTFRRSLDNRVMEKWTVRRAGRHERIRRWLPVRERDALTGSIHRMLWSLFERLQQRTIDIVAPDQAEFEQRFFAIQKVFLKLLRFDRDELQHDAELFRSIYGHVGILPPDMYLSLVLQATAGCSYNHCNYCSFYEGQSYRVKSPAEFNAHIALVKAYFGSSIAMRKTIFLGEANALDMPQSKLMSLFAILNRHFSLGTSESADTSGKIPMHGVYGFMTAFHQAKTVEDLIALREAGLRRVYIGMESGSKRLLRFLNKPGDNGRLIHLVDALKQSGIAVGMIILLGAGGSVFYGEHVAETVRVIRELPLDNGDMLYLSPLVVSENAAYADALAEADSSSLALDEMNRQKQEMLSGFDLDRKKNRPKATTYNIAEFIY